MRQLWLEISSDRHFQRSHPFIVEQMVFSTRD
jgi:hypothetical protein